MTGLRSGQGARAAGVNQQTLRYYERRGLLAEPHRTLGGHRLYPAETVLVLRVIKTAQRLGFSLDEVRRLLDSQAEGTQDWRSLVEEKIREVELRVRSLEAISQILRDSLECGCSAWDGCTLLVPNPGGCR